MTIISEPVGDLSTAGDTREVVFYLENPRAKSSGPGIITVRRVTVIPEGGVLTTPHLDPGPAKVKFGFKSYPIVIPFAEGNTTVRLWPLIEAGVTPADQPVVNAAIEAKNDAVQAALDAAAARDIAVEAAQTSGKSAYEIAVLEGFAGTEAQWLETLVGPEGDDAYQVALANGFVGTQQQWLDSLVSTEPGPEGPRGVGIEIDQQVSTYADLPVSAADNYGVLVKADGRLYVYDGGWPADGAGIQIVGPKGEGYIAEDPENPGHFLFESAPSVEAAAAAALAGAEGFKDDAEAAAAASAGFADDAAGSVTAAAGHVTTAAGHVTAAQGYASDASNSAIAAGTSESDAADSATNAATSASNAADSEAAAAAYAEDAAEVVATGIPNATTTVKGGIILTGALGGTFDAPTVPGLASKADASALASKADLVTGKVPTSQLPDPLVSSVAGRTGAVTIAAADITDSTTVGRNVVKATDPTAARSAITAAVATTASLAASTPAMTVTATTNTDVPNLSITKSSTGTGAEYVVEAALDVEHTGGTGHVVFNLAVDGSTSGAEVILLPASGIRLPIYKKWNVTGLSAGSHTYKLRARRLTGTGTVTVYESNSVLTVTGP